MNSKEYIESGILESYALGMCNDSERAEVEKLCAENIELKNELTLIQKSIEEYSNLNVKNPDNKVKQNLLNQLDFDEQFDNTENKLIKKSFNFGMAASIALFGLSLILNFYFYFKYKSTNDQLVALKAENSVLTFNSEESRVKLNEIETNLSIVTNTDVKKIALNGVASSPSSLVNAYWNTKTKEVFIEIKNLPKIETNTQYQLWAIVDGKPVNAGLINEQSDFKSKLFKMESFETVQAFAITIEKIGGSLSPTLEKMVVIGNNS